VEVRRACTRVLALPDHDCAGALRALDLARERRQVVALEDRHVAGVSAAFRDPALRGRVVAHRRDHLEEGLADRQHRVVQAEHRDARIAERTADAEHVAQRGDRSFEIGRRERDLTQPHAALS
jgi:hypothetical protein